MKKKTKLPDNSLEGIEKRMRRRRDKPALRLIAAIKNTQPVEVTQEEIKAMSILVRERRAVWATMALATFSTQTGMAGEEVQTVVKDLLTDLFHLSDGAKFNLESTIDQARDAYEAEVRIDDIEEDYLRQKVLDERNLKKMNLAGGAEACATFSDPVMWVAPLKAKARKRR